MPLTGAKPGPDTAEKRKSAVKTALFRFRDIGQPMLAMIA